MNSSRSILTMLVLLLAGIGWNCGDKDDGPTDPGSSVPTQLVGTWLYQSVTVNGVPTSLALALQWQQGTESAQFTVSGAGSFLYEELDADQNVNWFESGTIAVDGNDATILVTSDSEGQVDPPDSLSGTWHLEGDILSLSVDYQGATFVFYTIKIS